MFDPLSSPETYQAFICTLGERHPSIHRSTLVYIPSGALFGRVKGMLIFERGLILCVHEYLNFELGVIEGYGYEVSHTHVSSNASDFPAATEYCRATFPHKKRSFTGTTP